ncbi:hypothetical protein ACHQM5_004029 [Ranunculus cassubicifolius]
MLLCLLTTSHFKHGESTAMKRFERRENNTVFIPVSAADRSNQNGASSSNGSSSKDESSSSWKQERVLNASDHEVPSGPNPVSN